MNTMHSMSGQHGASSGSISSARGSVGNRHPNSNNNNNNNNSHDNPNMYPSGKSTSSGNNNNNNNNSNSNSGLYGLSTSTNSNYDNTNNHNFDDIDDNHNTANSTAATTTTTTTSTRLTVNAHAFAGAILSPKHALELTPTLCLQIATALADLNHPNQHQQQDHQQQQQQPKQSNHHHYSHHNNNSNYHTSHTNTKKRWVVPYTVWITEAWRVLGWAEPSAALFWEMATMYYALMIASRESMVHQAHMIPPILSCGSTSSFGSHGTTAERTPTHATSFLQQQQQQQLLGLHPQHMTTTASSADSKKSSSARMNSVVSAKELPLWLVGTFLILHCEELALQRNLSGHDERRFHHHHHQQQQQKDTIHNATTTSSSSSFEASSTMVGGNKIDFSTLFQYPSLSPRYVGLKNKFDSTSTISFL
jgi:hypothetical protein